MNNILKDIYNKKKEELRYIKDKKREKTLKSKQKMLMKKYQKRQVPN